MRVCYGYMEAVVCDCVVSYAAQQATTVMQDYRPTSLYQFASAASRRQWNGDPPIRVPSLGISSFASIKSSAGCVGLVKIQSIAFT